MVCKTGTVGGKSTTNIQTDSIFFKIFLNCHLIISLQRYGNSKYCLQGKFGKLFLVEILSNGLFITYKIKGLPYNGTRDEHVPQKYSKYPNRQNIVQRFMANALKFTIHALLENFISTSFSKQNNLSSKGQCLLKQAHYLIFQYAL